MVAPGGKGDMAVRRREFLTDEEFVAVGMHPIDRRPHRSAPPSSSSDGGSSGDGSGSGSGSQGDSRGGDKKDDSDEDEDEEEEEEEEKEGEGQGEGGEQGQREGEEQGQEDVIEFSSDDHPQQWAEQMEIDEGHGQADFTAQAAEGQGEGADPSDDESVFSADLLRWADEHTETQAAAQLVYAYQHLRVEQVKSADSLQRLTDMRDFNALEVDFVAHVLERYKM
ncbi:hypothetical protein AcV5_003068 [Taiwanofungus camphoratus]|nr:hypothetical protein AcV5_003068 [Antrodia cinnamomea]